MMRIPLSINLRERTHMPYEWDSHGYCALGQESAAHGPKRT